MAQDVKHWVKIWKRRSLAGSWIRVVTTSVSHAMIRVKAKALSTVTGFKVSKGWLFRFLKCHALVLHRDGMS